MSGRGLEEGERGGEEEIVKAGKFGGRKKGKGREGSE